MTHETSSSHIAVTVSRAWTSIVSFADISFRCIGVSWVRTSPTMWSISPIHFSLYLASALASSPAWIAVSAASTLAVQSICPTISTHAAGNAKYHSSISSTPSCSRHSFDRSYSVDTIASCIRSSHPSTAPSAVGAFENGTTSPSEELRASIVFDSEPSPKVSLVTASKHLPRWGCTACGSRV